MEIRNVHVLSGDGEIADFRRVPCPAHARTVTLEQCLACAESGGLARDETGHIEYASCRYMGAGAEARREQYARAELERTPVSEVMTADVFAVRPDVSLEALMDVLLERGFGGAPVVDEEGRPVGMVSKTDVLDERFVKGDTGEAMARGTQVSRGHFRVEVGPGVHAEPVPYDSVADAMTRATFTLPEEAPVVRAAALMAERGVHRLLVVSGDGRLSGIVTSSDIVRWIGRRAGQGEAAAP